MILQRLISEAAKLPDLSQEVKSVQEKFKTIGEELGHKELELLMIVTCKTFACENNSRRRVDLKNIEANIVKAKHAAVEEEEDFV
jgi:hypothetical protein